MKNSKVAIYGASGYTGLELIRLLQNHRHAEVVAVSSDTYAGKKIGEVFGFLDTKWGELVFWPHDELPKTPGYPDCGTVFFCMPHGQSMKYVESAIADGKVAIDLGADFRLKTAEDYETWYKHKHTLPKLLDKAVYGLPELHRKQIRKADIIAVPGCYPTSTILAAAPIIAEGLYDAKAGPLIVHSLSGISGAGRKADSDYNFTELNENFYPYNVKNHRHIAEMRQELGSLGKGTGKSDPEVVFTPVLTPASRCIVTTVYIPLAKPATPDTIARLYRSFYGKEPFVRITDSPPKAKDVRGSNFCRIAPGPIDNSGKLFRVFSAIDNLVKGASGQAIQCWNIRSGLEEGDGLTFASAGI